MTQGGGRFDFDDGGTYCGGWEDGKAHGHGVCTGPKGQGEYSGAWQYGFEVSGVYTWPSGNSFKGQWFQGKRHGLGVETKGRWVYRGEWTQGFKGRYGVRQSVSSGARYEGTWTTGLQDGYGCETYADGGTYHGQWLRGMRHGYGVRASVPYGLASHYRPKTLRASLTSLRSENEDEIVVKNRDKKLDESRGGFVLKAKSDETPPSRRRSIFDKQGRSSLRKTLMSGLKLKKQKSTGDINSSPSRQTGSVRSTISNISHVSADSTQSGMTNASMYTDSNLSFVSQDDITDINVTETYMGEWKNDKRSGFGVSERSDGLKYEGEWYNNKKYGYGVTTFKDGAREEGKYKNNVLISSGKKNKLFLIRTSKLRERVDNAVLSAQRWAQISLQKADLAISRMANARAKAEQADQSALKSEQDSDFARLKAKEYAPEFHQPGSDMMKKKRENGEVDEDEYDFSYVKSLQNHNPHRSKSMLTKSPHDDGGLLPGGLVPMVNSSPDGSPLRNNSGYDYLQMSNAKPDSKKMTSIPNHSPHNRSPSLKIRRYSFLAGSRRGRGFSEIFNSTILNDHFDQYSAQRDDSGLGKELLSGEERYRGNHITDPSPDSGVSESLDDESKNRPLQRRRTMPCIVKTEGNAKSQAMAERETAHSSENIAGKNPDMYVIENGIRKRIKGVDRPSAQPHRMSKGDLPKEYKIESQNALGKAKGTRGSLPDITAIKQVDKFKSIPREEAYQLGTARREELRRLQDLADRRRQGDVTVILGDLKDFVQQRQLLVLVIAVNLSLATMFFNLLS
ncbi:junctophilin-1-like [Pecten maximus]|uniref:junctophilin-1-like n=1 Tax=Pecten maximus TaxID=6579 RepID=UPI0014582701|nr:junctophilin-1-like [Pecten maximus]